MMNPKDLDSRHLRHVIAVAEEGSIVRAAKKRLYLSEGSLARSIHQLERHLGFRLIRRHGRGVGLTPAGVVFVEEAKKAIAHLERAPERAAAASRGETGAVFVGYCPFVEPERLIQIRERFNQAAPEASIVFMSGFASGHAESVLAQRVAAALVMLPLEAAELTTKPLWRERLCAALPEASPLATSTALSEPLSIEVLSGAPAVWLAESVHPGFRRRLLEDCHKRGYAPKIAHEVVTYDEMLGVIGTGAGVGLVRESMARRVQARGVVFRDLPAPGLYVEVGAIHRADSRSKSLATLLQILADAVADGEERPIVRGIG